MSEPSTKERLTAALKAAGLPDLADRAEAGDYDECESDLALPISELAGDLAPFVIAGHEGAKAMRQQVINGDFDATDDEWDRWYSDQDWSPDDDE